MRLLFIYIFLFFSFLQNSWGENILNEFLVAKPSMPDPRFKETVIVMLYHNLEKGAAGLVVNKPIETMFISELFHGSNMEPPEKMIEREITLYWGGPVEPEQIYFIHSSDYKSDKFISSNKDFTVTQYPKILFDIAINKGPREFIILSGIAAWDSGQLDSELIQDNWDRKLNSYTSPFDNGNEMWSYLINSQDI